VDTDTEMGGREDAFPTTRCSVILSSGSPDPAERRQAFEALVQSYWRPIYKYLRLRWNADNESAKDLTQAFLARTLETDSFARYDPAKARFRTYLRMCLDGFVANQKKSANAEKRGGGRLALDFAVAENELAEQAAASSASEEEIFDREFVRSLFGLAVEDLARACAQDGKSTRFQLFERYDLAGRSPRPTYEELAAEFGLPVTQVTNHLAYARRRLRAFVLDRLRAGTGSDDEFREEARRILGGDVP
jgi:RNA polymerase sigma factor (sigma-70 family)